MNERRKKSGKAKRNEIEIEKGGEKGERTIQQYLGKFTNDFKQSGK